MADENFGTAVGRTLQARAELVALAGGVKAFQYAAQGVADEILRQLGAVFSEVGFQNAQVGLFDGQLKTAFFPEITHRFPDLVGRTVDDQPALVASAFYAYITHAGSCGGHLAGLAGPVSRVVAGGHSHARHGVAVVARELAQVWRNIE